MHVVIISDLPIGCIDAKITKVIICDSELHAKEWIRVNMIGSKSHYEIQPAERVFGL